VPPASALTVAHLAGTTSPVMDTIGT